MKILAIDPGNEQSAWCTFEDGTPRAFLKEPNQTLLTRMALADFRGYDLAIEMVASYGMPVGREVFETCVWIGRFVQEWHSARLGNYTFVYRKDVKLHLCGQSRAKDANIRQALIDRYGGRDKAIGKKSAPGPLYGISADVWSALAVAVTYADGAVKQEAA
jgi:hypothetical protein